MHSLLRSLLILFVGLLPAVLRADDVVFGPRVYPIAAGGDQTVTEQFTLQSPCDLQSSSVYALTIQNGDATGNRVSSASISINGTEVVAERDFNQQVASVERRLQLAPTNTVSVRVKGGTVSGKISITIRRSIDVRENVFVKTYTAALEPSAFADQFAVSDPAGRFSIVVQSRSSQLKHVSVRLNGAEVISEQELRRVAVIEKPVSLTADNRLEVLTKGEIAGLDVTIAIARHVADTAGPEIAHDPVPIVAVTSPFLLRGVVSDRLSGVATLTVNAETAAFDATGAFERSLPLSAGVNRITVTATDCAGNRSDRQIEVTLQNDPPVLVVTTPITDSFTNDRIIHLSGTADDAQGISNVVANGTPMHVAGRLWSGSITLEPREGVHAITVVATDTTGRSATATTSVVLDTTPPIVAARVEPQSTGNGWITTPAVVVFACSDEASGIADCPATLPFLTNGPNQRVSGTARDRAGNAATGSITANVDTVGPALAVAPLPAAVRSPGLTVSGAATDVTSGIQWVTCNGQPATLAGGTFSCFTALEIGPNLIVVRASDVAGHERVVTQTITYDPQPPSLHLPPPSDGSVTITTAEFDFVGYTDDESGVAAVLVNDQNVPVSNNRFWHRLALNEGDNEITVVATDNLGNATTSTVTLRRVSPLRLAILEPPDLATVRTATVTVHGSITPGTVAVAVNGIHALVSGDAFTANDVPLAQGRTVITATATTAAGSTTVANVHVFRDSVAPRVDIYSPAEGAVVSDATVTVSGMVDDIVVGTVNAEHVGVRVNGVEARVANRSFIARDVPLSVGTNAITVVATDQAGNSTSVQRAVLRDAAASRVRIVSGNFQESVVGSDLSEPLVVALTESTGGPLANQPVTFTIAQNDGTLHAGGARNRTINVLTDSSGRAEVRWTLGMRAGVGNQRVRATSAAGEAEFFAAGRAGVPARLLVDMGTGQFGLVGQRLQRPFTVVVTDDGFNRLPDVPVTFAVVAGGGTIDGSPLQTVRTDSDGRAWVTPTLGPEPGNDNNVVRATVSSLAEAATFVASGRLGGSASATAISGVILDNSNMPIEGVTVRIDELPLQARTDTQGQFIIDGAPAGYVKLLVDGSTAQRPGIWPTLEFAVYTLPGENNTLGMPIYLLPLDVQRGVQVDEVRGAKLTLPELPGFSLTIAPGSALFPNGGRAGTVSATLVHADKVPMVPGFGQQPRFIVTIQPPGVHFDPPAHVTFPNVDGLEPGSITDLYSFDHDLGQFVIIGTGSVSEDGSMVVADPGVGIMKGGWHGGGPPPPVGNSSSVSVRLQAPAVGAVDDIVTVTASGTPAREGVYFDWRVIDDPADPNDDPAVAEFVTQPACPGAEVCVAQLRLLAGGTATVQVSYRSTAVVGTSAPRVVTHAVPAVHAQAVKVQAAALEISAVMFLNSYPITKDRRGGASLLSPVQWVHSSNAPAVQDPVAVKRSMPAGTPGAQPQYLTLKVRFRVKGRVRQAISGVTIRGSGGGFRWVRHGVTIPAGATELDWMVLESEVALPDTTRFYDPLRIDWTYELAGTAVSAGSTANPLYVTLNAPLPGELYYTALHLAVSKDGAVDAVEALANTWTHFANPDGTDDLKTWDDRPLYYYRQGFGFAQCPINPADLLTSSNATAQCGAFAKLMQLTLAANGIDVKTAIAYPLYDTGFLVKHWTPTAMSFPNDPGYKWRFTAFIRNTFITMVAPNASRQFGDLQNEDGLPGQHAPTPSEKYFANHIVVHSTIPGAANYYDPSYGVTYDGEAAFERVALFGLVRAIGPRPTGDLFDYKVRLPFPTVVTVVLQDQ